ncbi:FtsB family cell division protein [Arenibaculum pallidiluteum]|uniref:FtsB family cell division protein n=1 Tax=Arenibaculum pallidiluteum TaxID=2812559 RepID=UPI001F3BCB2D|nr:septum formation initiator family protein [Arenibaculum pallidiluteum]
MDRIRDALGRAARNVVWQAAFAAVVAYFAYHAIHGDRGLIALSRLQGEIDQAEGVLGQIRGERERLDHRASLLRPDNLDPDMLDERARAMLNFADPDEIVIPLPQGSGASEGTPRQ